MEGTSYQAEECVTMQFSFTYSKNFDAFVDALGRASKGDFRAQLAIWLEEQGLEFLDIVQQKIIDTGTVDTGRLLDSFNRGAGDNIWELNRGGLTLTVGTQVEYAEWVNDGHWTTSGAAQRFVPGSFAGGKFTYNPGSSTGMVLKRKWVEGKHFWESALSVYEHTFGSQIDAKLQKWIDETFGK